MSMDTAETSPGTSLATSPPCFHLPPLKVPSTKPATFQFSPLPHLPCQICRLPSTCQPPSELMRFASFHM